MLFLALQHVLQFHRRTEQGLCVLPHAMAMETSNLDLSMTVAVSPNTTLLSLAGWEPQAP